MRPRKPGRKPAWAKRETIHRVDWGGLSVAQTGREETRWRGEQFRLLNTPQCGKMRF